MHGLEGTPPLEFPTSVPATSPDNEGRMKASLFTLRYQRLFRARAEVGLTCAVCTVLDLPTAVSPTGAPPTPQLLLGTKEKQKQKQKQKKTFHTARCPQNRVRVS